MNSVTLSEPATQIILARIYKLQTLYSEFDVAKCTVVSIIFRRTEKLFAVIVMTKFLAAFRDAIFWPLVYSGFHSKTDTTLDVCYVCHSSTYKTGNRLSFCTTNYYARIIVCAVHSLQSTDISLKFTSVSIWTDA